MPWKKDGVSEERFRFIEEWKSDDWSLAELCEQFGVTRKTGYKWLERYEAAAGMEGLRDQSRAPHRHPNALTEASQERILKVRAEHPYWGARKIRAFLKRQEGADVIPAVSSIGNLLKTNGLTIPRKRRPRSAAEPAAAGPRDGSQPGVVRGFQRLVSQREWGSH